MGNAVNQQRRRRTQAVPREGRAGGGSGPGAVARCWVGPAAEQGGCAACSLSGLQRRGACGHTRRRKEGGRFKPSTKWGD